MVEDQNNSRRSNNVSMLFCMDSCGLNYHHIYTVVKQIRLCKVVDVYAYLNRGFIV